MASVDSSRFSYSRQGVGGRGRSPRPWGLRAAAPRVGFAARSCGRGLGWAGARGAGTERGCSAGPRRAVTPCKDAEGLEGEG